MEDRFRLNSPPVVLETVDEETIIVNLDSGCYFDLNHSGGRILEALAAGAAPLEAARRVAEAYGVPSADLEGPVGELVAQLLEEGIIAASSEPNGNGAPSASSTPPSRPFEAPALGKYTDMQELLLLDPIHEVDESGWPNRV